MDEAVRNQVANSFGLAAQAKAIGMVRLEEEFQRRYDGALELANAADANPTPDSFAALLGYYEEFAEWINAHPNVKKGGEYVLNIKNLNKLLLKHIKERIGQLEAGNMNDPEVREEWEGWRRLWMRVHNETEELGDSDLTEVLAAKGLELKTGKNDSGEDIAWTERLQPDLPEPPPLRTRPTRHSGWEEVVDLQDEMIRFWYTKFGRTYGRAWGQGIIDAGAADVGRIHEQQLPGNDPWKPSDSEWALHLDALNRTALQLANPMWVSPEVQELIDYAARHSTFELSHLSREDVFPSLHGFCLFPEPFIITDQYGKKLSFRAISWMPATLNGEIPYDIGERVSPLDAGGVLLMAYTHKDDHDDYPLEIPENGEITIKASDLPVMSMCYVTPWRFNSDQLPIDMTGSGVQEFCAIVQTLWRFAKQTIIAPEGRSLPRAARRRAERRNLQSDVVVVKLRKAKRPTPKDHEPTKMDFDHRFWVGLGTGGFWRNQWYPKLGTHQQVFIQPYLKGPEDAPIIYKPLRAYEVTR